jgi:hypothetical protein
VIYRLRNNETKKLAREVDNVFYADNMEKLMVSSRGDVLQDVEYLGLVPASEWSVEWGFQANNHNVFINDVVLAFPDNERYAITAKDIGSHLKSLGDSKGGIARDIIGTIFDEVTE